MSSGDVVNRGVGKGTCRDAVFGCLRCDSVWGAAGVSSPGAAAQDAGAAEETFRWASSERDGAPTNRRAIMVWLAVVSWFGSNFCLFTKYGGVSVLSA